MKSDFINQHEIYLLKQGKSYNTIKNYQSDLNQMFKKTLNKSINEVEDEDLKLITINHLDNFEVFMLKNEYENTTIRRKIAAIQSLFKFLYINKEYIPEDPSRKLEKPKKKDKMPIYLTLNESQKFLSVIDNKRDYAIIMLFLNDGLRLSELTKMNIEQVENIENDTFIIDGKGNKERKGYLNDATQEAIFQYLKERKKIKVEPDDIGNPLFISNRKERISEKSVQKLVKKYKEKARIKKNITPHSLRHTAATLMHKHGNVDIRTLQKILGHSNISTTQIYTHIDNEQSRKAVKSNPLNKVI